jgi:hypothetical protein
MLLLADRNFAANALLVITRSPPARSLIAMAFAGATGFGAVVGNAGRTTTVATAAGKVRCESGADIVGIWISAPYGHAGWADFRRIAGTGSAAAFQRTVASGTPFALNVGCGGSPEVWAMTATSGP